MSVSLEIKIQHSNSIDIVDLNKFLLGLSSLYIKSSKENNIPKSDSLQLKIKEVRSGSSIFELIPDIAAGVIFPAHEIDSLTLFTAFLQTTTNYFVNERKTLAPENLTKQELQHIKAISDIVAKDHGVNSFVEIAPVQNAQKIINNTYHLNFAGANILSNQIAELISSIDQKKDSTFTEKLLQITQLSTVTNDKRVNKGVIEDFSNEALQIKFSSESDRKKILELNDNVFKKIFLVSGKALQKSGKYIYYIVDSIEDSIDNE